MPRCNPNAERQIFNELLVHAKESLELAKAANAAGADEHMDEGIKHLEEAIKHAEMDHAGVATEHVEEAVVHIRESGVGSAH